MFQNKNADFFDFVGVVSKLRKKDFRKAFLNLVNLKHLFSLNV